MLNTRWCPSSTIRQRPAKADLVTEKIAIAQINLGNFLGTGAKILDSGNIGDAKCPFCLSDYDLGKLRVEVEARLQAIAHVARRLEEVSGSVEALLASMVEVTQICETLDSRYEKLPAYKALFKTAKTLSAVLGATHSELGSRFARNEKIVIPDNVLKEILDLDDLAFKQRTSAVADSDSLKFTDYENKILRLLEKFNNLRRAFFYYEIPIQR